MSVLPAARAAFTPPPGSDAATTPEARGLTRDGVRLLVAGPGGLAHHRFADLADALSPGDLLVVNTSATVPAALTGRHRGRPLRLHVSTQLDDGSWVVEPRRDDNAGPDVGAWTGQSLDLPGGVRLRLVAAYPSPTARPRLWRAVPTPATDRVAHLSAHGRPVDYPYLSRPVDLAAHQNVYATEPGSAEAPSAGRPFTPDLLVRLLARGVAVAPIALHCGVSSPEAHEPPAPEWFRVPEATARLARSTAYAGRRVVAVGTTVVRALESAVATDGRVRPASGWTDLVVGPDTPARVVTGLVTGLHAPEASHLLLLEAVAGADLVGRAYAAAVAERYLWHEFGDSMLFLP